MGLYTSPMGAFLSERTMMRQTRKVPRLLYVEDLENNHTIRRSMGNSIVRQTRKHQRYRSTDLDLRLCPRREVATRRKGKCWRYRLADLDLGLSRKESHDKIMEREMSQP